MTAAQAAAVCSLPVGGYYLLAAKAESLGWVFVAVPSGFVAAVTAWRVVEEVCWPAGPARPSAAKGPRGVQSQAEAAERLNEMNIYYRERGQR